MIRLKEGPDLSGFLSVSVRRGLRIAAAIAFTLVFAPTAYMVIWAFWGTEVVGILRGPVPTLSWFSLFFGDPSLIRALLYSILLAAVVATTALIIAFLQAYLGRFAARWTDVIAYAVTGFVVLFPSVPYAMSIKHVADTYALGEFMPLLIAHVALALPLQFVLFDAAREIVPIEALWSGRIMGATHSRNLRYVFLPYVRPLLITCFAVAFFFSLDDVVIAGFVITSPQVTIPVRLWNDHTQLVRPDAAVIGACLLAVVTTIAVAQSRPQGELGHVARTAFHWTRHFGKGFLVAVGGFLLYKMLLPESHSFWARVGEWTSAAAVGITSGLAVAVLRVRRPIKTLISIQRAAMPELRGAGQRFMFDAIDRLSAQLRRLEGGSAVHLSIDDVADFGRECFKVCKGLYVGTDRHVPNQFFHLYPQYLEQQELPRSGSRIDDVRILILDRPRYDQDVRSDAAAWRSFLKHHDARGYNLLIAPWELASKLASAQELPSPDIGVFGADFVVFFEPPASSARNFTVTVRSLKERKTREAIRLYLNALIDVAEKITTENSLPRITQIQSEDRRELRSALTQLLVD